MTEPIRWEDRTGRVRWQPAVGDQRLRVTRYQMMEKFVHRNVAGWDVQYRWRDGGFIDTNDVGALFAEIDRLAALVEVERERRGVRKLRCVASRADRGLWAALENNDG